MTDQSASSGPKGAYLPVLTLLFVGSGCAALIYEVVWFQMLQLVIGATGVSLAILLGTFMGGMFLGSLLLPRFVPMGWSPLRVYAALELGIAVAGLALLVLVPAVNGVYATIVPRGFGSVMLRGVVCGALLIPPTVLMGATLPAISRQVDASRAGVAWMGFFYSGNIAGAVLGCLLAGFVLLRVYDIPTATFAAVALNVGVAGLALYLAPKVDRVQPEVGSRPAPAPDTPTAAWNRRTIYWAIGLSGLTALGSQVIWTRVLSLLLGTTTYTFSLILAVFLIGLGGGSSVGSRLAKTARDPRLLFAACQLFAGLSIVYTAFVINGVLPSIVVPESVWIDPTKMFFVDLARAGVAILPAPIFWGASFPLAVAAVAERGDDPGRLIGGVYAANTAGAIAGALAGGLVLVPLLGTHGGQRMLVVFAVFAAALLGAGVRSPESRPRTKALRWAAAIPTAALLAWSVAATNPSLITQGRHAPYSEEIGEVLYVGEGLHASVAVTEDADSARAFRISGKVAASTSPEDMVLQRMLGHFSSLFHEGPRSVLIVGFGAGVTAGTFVTVPGIERIVICEIEPLATGETAEFFAEANHAVLNDPRVEVVNDDARHYLLSTDETFDIITSDPIHPWVKGAAALYTVEYFELARRHLNPGGVITQWVPLYESTLPVVMSELATFSQVFPDASVWSSHRVSPGFDVVMAARLGGLEIDVEELDDRLAAPEYQTAAASLGAIGLQTTEDVLTTYVTNGYDLENWLQAAEINRDRSLKLMYLAGLGVNADESAAIHDEVFRHRTFPEAMVLGPPDRIEYLRSQIIAEIR